jgi:hypothetical protein
MCICMAACVAVCMAMQAKRFLLLLVHARCLHVQGLGVGGIKVLYVRQWYVAIRVCDWTGSLY